MREGWQAKRVKGEGEEKWFRKSETETEEEEVEVGRAATGGQLVSMKGKGSC